TTGQGAGNPSASPDRSASSASLRTKEKKKDMAPRSRRQEAAPPSRTIQAPSERPETFEELAPPNDNRGARDLARSRPPGRVRVGDGPGGSDREDAQDSRRESFGGFF